MIETSPMTKIVGLGLGAALLLALMYLFTLSKVADDSGQRAAKSIDTILGPNLDASQPTKASLTRDGTGLDAPRTYVVRLHPAATLSTDPKALQRLCVTARDLLFEEVGAVKGAVTVHCVVEGGSGFRLAWRKSGGDDLRIEDLVPPPDLPAAPSADDAEGAE